ncbi:scavenger receptor cysteine-rich type 1 protein M130-like [Hemitrygon akajei]|uniref:scavenger receptor cysteine-rich type 1 protein M130-like n=1 Tax=Hemitrygon akajei TaxID=2704970 RepID=UPI003BFA1658
MTSATVIFISLIVLTGANQDLDGAMRLRLTNGTTRCSGRLEIWHNGTWGTVCRKGWGLEEEEVVCRHLGCGFGGRKMQHSFTALSTSSTQVWHVDCSGTESSLWHCDLKQDCHFRRDAELACDDQPTRPSMLIVGFRHTYLEGEDITIQCSTPSFYRGSVFYLNNRYGPSSEVSLAASANDFSVSFVIANATAKQSGDYLCRYQIYRDGVWVDSASSSVAITVQAIQLFVCARFAIKCDRWDESDAMFTYAMIGVLREEVYNWIISPLALYPTPLSQFSHTPISVSLLPSWPDPHYFHHVADDAKLTLVNGPDNCSGRVEIHHRGERGRFGNGGWDLEDAEVLCRQVGCGFGESLPSFGPGTGVIWYTRAGCWGNEKSLWECNPQKYLRARYWNKEQDASAKCSANPLKPTISLSRSPSVFVEGESINIECVAPRYYYKLAFYLRKVGGDVLVATAAAFRGSFAFINATSTIGGSYNCWYQLERGGKHYNSSVSESVNLTVGDSPAKPIITQDIPQQNFLAGASTILKCIAPYLTFTTGFFIYRKGEEKAIHTYTRKAGKTMPFLAPVGTKVGRFYYTCAYQVQISGRFFNSTPSDALEIIVTDKLSAPRLEIMQSTGTFNVNISISCLATNNFAGGVFYLYKEGHEGAIDSRQDSKRSNRVSFRVSKANKTNEGYYSCVQQVGVDGRLYSSFRSNKLKLNITDKIELRLIDGMNRCSGRVEVFHNGKWWRICAPDWKAKEINVVCRHMGCGFVASETSNVDYGRRTGQVLPNAISCSGQEATLWQCFMRSTDSFGSCNRQRVAVANCSGRPEKPVILLDRSSGHFMTGEKIKIHCRAASYFPGNTFYLFKLGEEVEIAKQTATKHFSHVAFSIVNASVEVTGSYVCAYQVERFGTTYASTKSLSIEVIVTGKYPKPTITVRPQRDTLFVGDRVQVECVVPRNIPTTQVYIQKRHDHIVEIIRSRFSVSGASATLENLTVGARLNFTCMYQGRMRGRIVNSTWSDALQLAITDRPPKPRLAVDRQDPSMLQKQIRVTCRRTKGYSGITFHLYKDGSAEPIAFQHVQKTRTSARFDIDNLDETNSGNYTCGYEIEWMGNRYNSERSDPIGIKTQGTRLRLRKGNSLCSGVVEVYYNQAWSPMCAESWSAANAEVTCKQLNCGFSLHPRAEWRKKRKEEKQILTGVNCQGSEKSLSQCSHPSEVSRIRCLPWAYAAVTCKMKPPQPTIDLQRRFATFIERQNISIECTTRHYYAGSRFYLGKVGKAPSLSSWPTRRTEHSATFTILNASLTDEGEYTCLYEVQRNGNMWNSTESQSLYVHITDRPPPPILSLHGTYIPHLIGSDIVLDCFTPFSWFAREIGLYAVVGDSYHSVENFTESDSHATFTLSNLTIVGRSNYSCRYSYQFQDRLIYSKYSSTLTVTITE